MKKSALFLNTLIITSLFLAVGAKGVMAVPNLMMNPSTGTYANGEEFSITVKANSGTEIVGGVDGVGTYDSTRLELVSIVKATSMVFNTAASGGNCSINTATGGKFSFSCYSNDALTDTAINGDLVVFNFKAKAVGTAAVNFTCADKSTIDSNIVKTSTSSDIIVCNTNVNGSYTITAAGSSSTTTSTITPTVTAVTTGSATLPQTGAIGSTVGLIVFGAISLASALFLKFL